MNEYPPRVTLFDDGVYRWSYDMDMWHNLFMLKLVLTVLGVMCIILSLTMLAGIGPARLSPKGIALLFLIPAAVLFALTLLIYLICALVMHGNYRVRFEMNQSAVIVVQSSAVKKRNNTLAAIAVAVGILAGQRNKAYRVGTALGAADAVGTTLFSDITRIKLYQNEDVIALREWFGLNQIYVNREDYAMVRDFILEHISEKARDRSRINLLI